MKRNQMDSISQNRRIAKEAAQRHGINATLFLRQMQQEAGFTDATSKAGAGGPAQIMPDTARAWGVKNVHDPHEAYDAAAREMARYLKSYGGSWAKALTAYNAGPGRVGGSLPAETQQYINIILHGQGDHVETLGSASHGTAGTVKQGTAPKYIPGSTKTDDAAALTDALLSHPKPGHLLKQYSYLVGTGQYTTTTPSKITTGTSPKYVKGKAADTGKTAKGVATFEGVKVAAWIKPILEYARQQGWKGKVNSGYRSLEEQTRIYNSGVRPAAKPGTSNHEHPDFPGGAVDVSDAQQLSDILRKSPYASKLVWAGSKDPVHFSHPHNGSY